MKYYTRQSRTVLVVLVTAIFLLTPLPFFAQDQPEEDSALDDEKEQTEEPTVDPEAEGETAQLEIRNATEYPLLMLFVSPADTDFFGPDILGADSVLEPGESRAVTVHVDEECFEYDVFAVDADGYPVYSILEVCPEAEEVVRLGQEGILEEDVPLEHFMRVEITNEREEAITSLFASAVDSRYRGADLLSDSQALEPGESMAIYVADTEGVSYNVLASTDAGDTIDTRFHLHDFRLTETEVVKVDIDADLPAE